MNRGFVIVTASTRRSFLSRAALAGGALVLPSGALLMPAGCSTTTTTRRTPHYFVFYFMVGGWDLMLGTDPLTARDGFFVPYEDNEIIEHGAHRFGPSFAPLLPFSSRLGVVRGIYCDALNHPQARFRMSTGRFKPPGAVVVAPSVQTLIARHLGGAYEIPNLSSDGLRPATFRGDEPDRHLEPLRVADVGQLQGMVDVHGGIGAYAADISAALARKDALTRARYDDVALAVDFEGFADLARAVGASDYGDRVGAMARRWTGDRWERQAEMAVEAIRHDVAPVITVGSGEFDAHTRAEYMTHAAAVTRGFRTVASIAAGLDAIRDGDGTLLDKTTIVVTSEFSRAPSRNELGGKHHWPTNAMVLLGKGIKRSATGGPTVFGEVDDTLNHVPINPRNGSHRRGADDLDMGHGLATVLAAAGLDPIALLGQDPIADLLG